MLHITTLNASGFVCQPFLTILYISRPQTHNSTRFVRPSDFLSTGDNSWSCTDSSVALLPNLYHQEVSIFCLGAVVVWRDRVKLNSFLPLFSCSGLGCLSAREANVSCSHFKRFWLRLPTPCNNSLHFSDFKTQQHPVCRAECFLSSAIISGD